MNTAKKVIILDKIKSPVIAQAIFILKDGAEDGFSAVEEAERIVAEYMAEHPVFKERRHLLPIILTALFSIGIIFALIMR
ncbi:MAG: hypothetical protein IKU60_01445 [Clostridia bacterium]|nr:hypothetical protein [Clostridia bacterium]